ncbi:MAG: proton-conducting transporter membrane subunit [Chloroflexaceae bacterium]
MTYLLVILFPVSMAASCFVLRKYTQFVIIAAVAVLATQAALIAQLPLNQPARLLGVTLTLDALTQLFILVFLGLSALAFIAALQLPHGENFVAVGLLIMALVCTILLLQDPFIVSLLLVGAGMAAVLAIVDLPTGAGMLVGTRVLATALKYLVLMVLAGVLMYLAFVLADIYRPGELPGRIPLARFILALLAAGFALRMALIPFHTWLPDMVEDAAPLVSALVIAVINITSLLVLVLSFQRFPILLVENPFGLILLRIGGIITAITGALLALNQPGMRRTLAYLLIYDTGMVFYGLASASTVGLTGALFEALNLALVAVLLFISLALLERPDGRTPGVVRRDLLRRWPVAGLGFLGGGLALLGLPPFSGFTSKMLLYQASAQHNRVELVALLLATGLASLALLRLARDRLLGPGDELPVAEPLMLGETELDRPFARRLEPEPRSTALLTLLLLVICLGIGLYPQPLLATIEEVIRGLTFIRAI